jgi:hypothetical protein
MTTFLTRNANAPIVLIQSVFVEPVLWDRRPFLGERKTSAVDWRGRFHLAAGNPAVLAFEDRSRRPVRSRGIARLC